MGLRGAGGGELEGGGLAADGIHIHSCLATNDERVPVRKATEEHEATFVMLNEFDAIAGAAAASEFGGGTEGGMG